MRSPAITPITAVPTFAWSAGQPVWVDLLTDDLAAAKAFYEELFGWEYREREAAGYTEIWLAGRPVAGIMQTDLAGEDSVWLVSVSVPDVDTVAERATDYGGSVLEGPEDLRHRGRYAVISDPQGAVLALLRTTSGDPLLRPDRVNEFLWAELWTPDVQAATEFYSSVGEYEARDVYDGSGGSYVVLVRNRKPRMGIVRMPWEDVPANWLPYIRVVSVADTVARAIAAGGRVIIAPLDEFGDGRVAILADPSGGAFAIQEARTQ